MPETQRMDELSDTTNQMLLFLIHRTWHTVWWWAKNVCCVPVTKVRILELMNMHLKHNEAQSARAESKHKGVNVSLNVL